MTKDGPKSGLFLKNGSDFQGLYLGFILIYYFTFLYIVYIVSYCLYFILTSTLSEFAVLKTMYSIKGDLLLNVTKRHQMYGSHFGIIFSAFLTYFSAGNILIKIQY